MSDKDTVYRQDAIDAIHGAIIDFFDVCDDDEESPMTYKDELLLEINKAITGRIKQLPSAQPEIIHCESCEHWKNEHLCECLSRYGTFETPKNFYCGYGKEK